ncbi:MAG TPA: ABC transporter permease [Acidobacteriota bacterium]|nr:ABC transporter permease [Acidobacteriota bacterium]
MRSSIPITEILQTALRALLRNWGRAVLTSLSMVVGTASLVLVVVTGISGRDYTLEQIRGVGSNLIIVSNQSTDSGTRALADRISMDDLSAIRAEVPGVRNAAPVIENHPTITLGGSRRRITLIGTTPEYRDVRNLEILSGSFIDDYDERYSNKVCLVTKLLAQKLDMDPFYRGYINFYGLQFKVIGIFRERVNTFGLTEVTDYSALIPLSVIRNFTETATIDEIYVSAASLEIVPQASKNIMNLVVSRHSNHAFFQVDNLSEMLKAADKITIGLTVVLLVIAAISLMSSGISIMNVMLITVTERTREIGIKKSLGAFRSVLLLEFLVEALILSGGGGLVGIFLGVAAPYSIRFFTTAIQIRVPLIAVILGFGVTVLIGLTFGMIPALRASRMNPVEALRYE